MKSPNILLSLVAAVAAVLLASSTARAEIVYVPEQYPTIQAAIDHTPGPPSEINCGGFSSLGNMIVVAPGIYHEHLQIPTGRYIVICGSGVDVTILDGDGTHEIIEIAEGGFLRLTNVTLRNGFSVNRAGAVDCRGHLTARLCAFRNNRLEGSTREGETSPMRAGAVSLSGNFWYNGDWLTDCEFFDNFADNCDNCAGALAVSGGGEFQRNTFIRNGVGALTKNSASCFRGGVSGGITPNTSNILVDGTFADNFCVGNDNELSNSTVYLEEVEIGQSNYFSVGGNFRRNRIGHGNSEITFKGAFVWDECCDWLGWPSCSGTFHNNLYLDGVFEAWTDLEGNRESSYLLRFQQLIPGPPCEWATGDRIGVSRINSNNMLARGYNEFIDFRNNLNQWDMNSVNQSCWHNLLYWGYSYPYPAGGCVQTFSNKFFCSTALPEDLSFDGFVDGADLSIMLNSWGPCAGCAADLTANSIVGGEDLAIILTAWGRSYDDY